MSTTKQTTFRLTEDEREFLEKLGKGDMTTGLRELIIKNGFYDFMAKKQKEGSTGKRKLS